MGDMCTEQQVKTVVEDILFNPNENGETIIGREVNHHLDDKAKDIVYRLTLRFAVPFVGLVFAGAGAWYTLHDTVERHSQALEEGNRWTQEEHSVYAKTVADELARQNLEIAELRGDYDELAKELRSDIREILNLLYTR